MKQRVKAFFNFERIAGIGLAIAMSMFSFAVVVVTYSVWQTDFGSGVVAYTLSVVLLLVLMFLCAFMVLCSLLMMVIVLFGSTSKADNERLLAIEAQAVASDDDNVVEGYRYAFLVVQPDRNVVFGALSRRARFGSSAVARCVDMHDVPDEDCSCGFYSLVDVNQLSTVLYDDHEDHSVLRVRLSGKVIEGEKGYRAARQDVLCVYLPSMCKVRACQNPTQYMEAFPEKKYMRSTARVLAPVCADHRQLDAGIPVFSVQQLRELLLTDGEVL